MCNSCEMGTATAQVERDLPTKAVYRLEPESEPSILLDTIQSQRWTLEELDLVLAELARKLAPVHVDIPEKDPVMGEGMDRAPMSPALARLNDNTADIRRKIQLIVALTKAIEV